jgi:hypothetical protein
MISISHWGMFENLLTFWEDMTPDELMFRNPVQHGEWVGIKMKPRSKTKPHGYHFADHAASEWTRSDGIIPLEPDFRAMTIYWFNWAIKRKAA